MRSRRQFVAAAAALAGAGVAISAQNSLLPQRELRLALAGEPTSADPHFAALAPNVCLAKHIFDALVNVDETGRYTPGLALSWHTLDPLTWEFKLRPGLRFHDGSELTAEDVLFSLQRPARILNSPAPLTTFSKQIVGMKIIDGTTLHLRTNEPYGGLPGDLSSLYIVSRKAAATAQPSDFDSGKVAVGTGPFRLVSFVKGSSAKLQRNAAYWGGAPAWEAATLLFMPEADARSAALRAGKVDAMEGVTPEDIESLRTRSDLRLVQRTSWRTVFLHLDQFTDRSPWITHNSTGRLDTSPLKDVRVRRAMSLALDRRALVSELLSGMAEPGSQLVPSDVLGHSRKLRVAAVNRSAARQLLAQAGYGSGFELTMHAPRHRYIRDQEVAQAIARQWGLVGIKTRVDTLPAEQYFRRARQGEFSVAMLGYGSLAGDFALRALLGTPDGVKGWGTWNWSKYSNAQLDRVIRRSLGSTDPLQRQQHAASAMEIAMQDHAVIPLHHQFASWAMRSGVSYIGRLDEFSLAHQFWPA
jgi:peptide/nickel transport system substrate-binding protein